MNTENRAIKLYLKNMPPLKAIPYIDSFRLPQRHSTILKLHIVDKKSIFQIADELYLSDATVKRIIKNSLEMIRLTLL